MIIRLNSADERPLYLQIMDEVRRALVTGALRPEEPLPSVRELATQLVVNPRTVSQAYHELEREGLVYVRRGHGTFVSPSAAPGRAEREEMARVVAKRSLLEARRSGVPLEELLRMIREVAAEEDAEASSAAEGATQ